MWLFRAIHVPGARSYGPLHNFLNITIFVSAIVGALETVESMHETWGSYLMFAEWTVVAIFSLEYVANIITSKNKLGYVFSFWGVVDFLAIAPSFLMLANITALKSASVLRILRVLRVLRVLKLAREAVTRIQSSNKVEMQRNPLGMNLTIYFLALFSVVMISSTLVYQAEYATGTTVSIEKTGPKTLRVKADELHGDMSGCKVTLDGYGDLSGPFEVKAWVTKNEKDDKADYFDIAFTDPSLLDGVNLNQKGKWTKDTLFTSVPQAMWWSIVTLTTVGYGDMYPMTIVGRLVAAITMLCGLALFGMLMNIIGKAMMTALFGTEELEKTDEEETDNLPDSLPVDWNPGWRHCPTCGQRHEEPALIPDTTLVESSLSGEIR